MQLLISYNKLDFFRSPDHINFERENVKYKFKCINFIYNNGTVYVKFVYRHKNILRFFDKKIYTITIDEFYDRNIHLKEKIVSDYMFNMKVKNMIL